MSIAWARVVLGITSRLKAVTPAAWHAFTNAVFDSGLKPPISTLPLQAASSSSFKAWILIKI